MEETLTDCLVRVKEDLSSLNRIRDYLETETETGHCSITWRTIEAFNSILGVCSSQHTPQTNALDTLLDSFHHMARNNTDPGVWNNFGFELGIICMKMLSAIERSEIFEVLFCKLLTVFNVICEHNTNVWKVGARQILNVFINKKFSLPYFERVVKVYLCIIRKVDSVALLSFSSQNMHLLRTLSKLVQKIGDFEIQSDIMELVFLHLSNNKQLMTDFFGTAGNNLLLSLQFVDFEADCRTYLNTLNRPRGGFERKVYSICCHVLYLGGCFVEPPVGTNSLWVDANKDTERLSIRCADFESEGNRVIYILFSDILNIQLAKEKTKGNRCLTIQTKSLSGLQFDVKNEDICLMIENGEALFQFVNFLNEQIRSTSKIGRKLSKTRDSLLIVRNGTDRKEKVQDNSITRSEKHGIDNILPDICNLFERANYPKTASTENQIKTSQRETKTPPRSQNLSLGSQELSPNSFVESLNKHIGRDSPEIPRTFEDSVETIEFMQRTVPGGGHKLFRSPNEVFDGLKADEPNNFNLIIDEEKENQPTIQTVKPRQKTYERKREKAKKLRDIPPMTMVLRDTKNIEPELRNTQSQDYFQHSAKVLRKRKPSLPKLKRNTKTKNKRTEVQEGNLEKEEETNRYNFRPGSRKRSEQNGQETNRYNFRPGSRKRSEQNGQETNKTSIRPGLRKRSEQNGQETNKTSIRPGLRKRSEQNGQETNKTSIRPGLRKRSEQNEQETNKTSIRPGLRKRSEQNEQETNKTSIRPGLRKYPEQNGLERRWENEMRDKDKMEKLKSGHQQKQANSDEKHSKSGVQEVRSLRGEEQQISRITSATKSKTQSDITQEKEPRKQQEVQLQKKPSLLDPNGYAYRRWCEPTTSERGNFWLRKLGAMQKSKSDSDNVFNFSEDSDSLSAKARRKKRRVVHSKRKYRTKEAEQTSLKQVKEILRRASPKGIQNVIPKKTVDSKIRRPEVLPKSVEPFPRQMAVQERCCDPELQRFDQISKHGSSLGPLHKNSARESNDESDFFNEEKDEDPPARIKKRERSIEETSLIKAHVKKKSKTTPSPGKFLSVLQHRLLKKKEQDKYQTDEIIRTVNTAVNHLFNHLQRKEVQKMMSYLTAAEKTVAVVAADVGSLNLRAKRMQRMMLYFQAGCSVSDLCESLEDRFSGVRAAFRDLEEKKDVSRMISRVNERLMGLIKSEIDKSINREFTFKRNKFLTCASLLNFKC